MNTLAKTILERTEGLPEGATICARSCCTWAAVQPWTKPSLGS